MKGEKELVAALKGLGPRLLQQGAAALYQEGLEIQRTSMLRTPVDTGALRASHETERPVIERDQVSVRIVVGGPAAPYALFVHEDLEAHHDVGEAKFLERSVYEAIPGLGERVARRIDLARAARG